MANGPVNLAVNEPVPGSPSKGYKSNKVGDREFIIPSINLKSFPNPNIISSNYN